MAITINTGFDVTTGSPLDGRAQVANKDARLALKLGVLYPGLVVYEIDTKKSYQYIGEDTTETNNEADWKEFGFNESDFNTAIDPTLERVDTIEETIESGSVNAANKLSTSRNIALKGVVSGNANFDGTKNIEISTINRRAAVGSYSDISNGQVWYKFASTVLTGQYKETDIIFKVSPGIGQYVTGNLRTHIRINTDINAPVTTFVWEYANFKQNPNTDDITTDCFKLKYYSSEDGTSCICELWVKALSKYKTYHFEVLSEHNFTVPEQKWELYLSRDTDTDFYGVTEDTLKANGALVDSTFAFISNNVASADKLSTERTIELTGNVTGSTTFDGSAKASISTTIANNSITNAKMADNSVNTSELVNSAVTTDKIKDNSVTNDKIAEGTIELDRLHTDVQNLLASAFDFKGGLTLGTTTGFVPTYPITTLTQGDVYKAANDGWFYNTYCATGDTIIYTDTTVCKVSEITVNNYSDKFLILEANIDITSKWPADNSQDSKVATVGAIKGGIKTAGTDSQLIADGKTIGNNNTPVHVDTGKIVACDMARYLNAKYIWYANIDAITTVENPLVKIGTMTDEYKKPGNIFIVFAGTNDAKTLSEYAIKKGVVSTGNSAADNVLGSVLEGILESAGDVFPDVTTTTVSLPSSLGTSFTTLNNGDMLIYGQGDLVLEASILGVVRPITFDSEQWYRIPMHEAKENADGLMSKGDKVNLNTLLDRYVADENDNHNSGNCTASGLYGNITNGRPPATDTGIYWNMMSIRNEPNTYTSQLFMSNNDRMFYRGKNSTDSANSSEVLLAHKAKTIGYGSSVLNWTTSAGILNDLDSSASNNKIDGDYVDYSVLCTGTGQLAIGNGEYTAGRLFARYSPGTGAGNASVWSQIVRIPTTKDSNNNTVCAAVGASNKPVYINANGVATACSGSTISFAPITDWEEDAEGKIYLTGMYLTNTGEFTNTLDVAIPNSSASENTGGVYISPKGNVLFGAAWNDYAEYRACPEGAEPGRVVCENGDDTVSMSTERLQPGALIVSDTFGFAIGQTDISNTPIAVAGRVLAYPCEDRDSYSPGDAVCAGPNGTVSKMTREEIREYPERIIGIVSAIPQYETWGTGNVPVNGRIWIKI